MSTNARVTSAPVTLDEALWRTRSYDSALSAVQVLKGGAALEVVDGEIMVDLTALAGAVCELSLPEIEVVETGSAL